MSKIIWQRQPQMPGDMMSLKMVLLLGRRALNHLVDMRICPCLSLAFVGQGSSLLINHCLKSLSTWGHFPLNRMQLMDHRKWRWRWLICSRSTIAMRVKTHHVTLRTELTQNVWNSCSKSHPAIVNAKYLYSYWFLLAKLFGGYLKRRKIHYCGLSSVPTGEKRSGR